MAEFSGWRQQASNKNLLINPRFKVNQRGQSEHLLYGYSVDGWVIYFDGKKRLKVLQDCVVLVTESIGSYFNLEQKIEGPFEKGTYTCSFLVDDLKKISFAYVVTNGTNYKYQYAIDKNLITFTFDIENAENITSIGIQKKEELGELKIYGAKLEQGPISTLALDLMQPYTPQDYQRELMECQRYFYRLATTYNINAGFGGKISGTLAAISFVLPQQMRTKPTAICNDITKISVMDGAGNVAVATSIGAEILVGNILRLNIGGDFSKNTYSSSVMGLSPGAEISFSAEL